MSCGPVTLDDGIAACFAPSGNESVSGARMLARVESKSVLCDSAPRRNRVLVASQIRWQRFGWKCFSSLSQARTRLRANSWRSSKLGIQIDTAVAICVPCSGGFGYGGSRRYRG
jgi:hypothetical protein